MGLRAYYVGGREARVEWPSVAVDVPYVWGSVAPTAIGHRPKNKQKQRHTL